MKKSYFLNFGAFVAVFLIDQYTKIWAEASPSLHYNRGFIMGFFAGAPDELRVVALGSVGALLFTIYLLLLYILPLRAKYFKLAVSILMGGLIGNVIDKLSIGTTRDFIPFSFGPFYYVFNLADVFLWIGTLVILWILLRKDYLLWYDKSNRKRILIFPGEQFALAAQVTLITFNACLLLGIFSFAVIKILVPPELIKPTPYALALVSLSLFLCGLSFLTGILMGLRRLGPLYALDLFVNDLLEGRERVLKLREGDHYKHLEVTATKIKSLIRK
jgi:signal peptidase II